MQAACTMQPCEWYAIGLSFGADYSLKIGMVYQQSSSVYLLNQSQQEFLIWLLM